MKDHYEKTLEEFAAMDLFDYEEIEPGITIVRVFGGFVYERTINLCGPESLTAGISTTFIPFPDGKI